MSQYQRSGESFFEHLEGFPTIWSEIPNISFSSLMCERNHNIRVVKNESLIKVCVSKEGLNVLCCYSSNKHIYAVAMMTKLALKDQESVEVDIC